MINRTDLNLWYHNIFKQTNLFKDMENTIEDSPWHREENVGIHTDMVVSEFIARSPTEWSIHEVIGFLACIFHDVGKPAAMTEKYSETRGHYRVFYSHELMSARLFENYVYSNFDIFENFGLNKNHIFCISWLIEYHVPWMIKDKDKRKNLALTISHIFNMTDSYIFELNHLNRFYNILLADQYGRISDDQNTKIENVNKWIYEFDVMFINSVVKNKFLDNSKPILYVPIAPSGSGKSTLCNDINPDLIYSLDTIRLKKYIPNYDLSVKDTYEFAYQMSVNDKNFKSYTNNIFIGMIKTGKSVFMDNMNLTKKSRRFYITEAKKKGYQCHAILLPNTIKELVSRQHTRHDKFLNETIVREQYMRLKLPSYGEFDKIIIN